MTEVPNTNETEQQATNEEDVRLYPSDLKNILLIVDTLVSRITSKTSEPLLRPTELTGIGQVRDKFARVIASTEAQGPEAGTEEGSTQAANEPAAPPAA